MLGRMTKRISNHECRDSMKYVYNKIIKVLVSKMPRHVIPHFECRCDFKVRRERHFQLRPRELVFNEIFIL